MIRSPASVRPLRLTSTGFVALLVSCSADCVLVVTVTLERFEVTAAPPGVRAVAVAVLVTDPASTSAWVRA